jgi:hypothetical protein
MSAKHRATNTFLYHSKSYKKRLSNYIVMPSPLCAPDLVTSWRLLSYVLLSQLYLDIFSPTYSSPGYIVTFSPLCTLVSIISWHFLSYVLLSRLHRDLFSPMYSCPGYIVTFSPLCTPVSVTPWPFLSYVLLSRVHRDLFSPMYSCHGYIVTFCLLCTPVTGTSWPFLSYVLCTPVTGTSWPFLSYVLLSLFPETSTLTFDSACQHFLTCIQENYNKLSMISWPVFLHIGKNITFFGEKPGRNSCMETLALTTARNSTPKCILYCLPPHLATTNKWNQLLQMKIQRSGYIIFI